MANINYCIIYGSVKVYGIGKDVEKFSQWLDFTWQVLRIMNYATLGIFQKLRCNSCPIDANRNRKLALFILTICFKIKSVLQENESLISQNQNLKSEIRKLEREKKRLIDVLSVHETSCPKRRKTTTTLHESSNNVDGYDDIIAEFSQQKSEPSAFQENLDFGSLPSIKVEDVSSPMDEDIFLRPPEPPGFYTDGFQSQTRLYNNHHHVPGSHHFLGVMTLGHHHYLDLDNRCIAL